MNSRVIILPKWHWILWRGKEGYPFIPGKKVRRKRGMEKVRKSVQ